MYIKQSITFQTLLFFFFCKENEKIYLLEQVSTEWIKGRNRSGCEGIFPVTYIEIKVPLSINSASSATSTQSSSASTTPTYQATTANSSSNLKVRSLYNFPAEVDGDLELQVSFDNLKFVTEKCLFICTLIL